MLDLAIMNVHMVTPDGVVYGGLGVEGETISYIGPAKELPGAKRVVDGQDHLAIPGFIDPHVHLGQVGVPQDEEILRRNFLRETRAALRGGVTTVGVFSAPRPSGCGIEGVRLCQEIGEECSFTDFFLHTVVSSERHIEEIPILARECGVWSFKHFFNANKPRHPGEDVPHAHCEHTLLFQSLQVVSGLGPPALGMVHCEDQDLINLLEDRLKTENRNDLKAWAEARPGWVEHLRMRLAFEIAKALGAALYFVHIGAAEGVDLMAEARSRGHHVWGETCPHYLTHTAEMEKEIGCWGKVKTAIKFPRDQDRLWEGIKGGNITNMGTDHVVCNREEKEAGGGKFGNIWKSRAGIAGGMEHWLPVMMTFGVHSGRISIEEMIRICSTNNAIAFGLYPQKGVLKEGSDADIVLVDPEREVKVDSNFYLGRGDWSIYEGWRLKGLPRMTVLRGNVVWDGGDLIEHHKARYLFRPYPGN